MSTVRSSKPTSNLRRYKNSFGLTLIEIVVVLMLVGALLLLAGQSLGTFTYWKEEGTIRSLSELISFLHRQAVVDQTYYRLELNFEKDEYRVWTVLPDPDLPQNLAAYGADVGNLTRELASFLSPAMSDAQSLSPPQTFPSLADAVQLPPGMHFRDVRTMAGKKEAAQGGSAYVTFSPRGFSEFAVIHLLQSAGSVITILVNPFTGNTEVFNADKDFQWTYSKKKKNASE